MSNSNSGGFNTSDAASILLKKYFWVNNTGSGNRLYNEPDSVPIVWPKQICSDIIPDEPPTDFFTLNSAQIATAFDIDISEISSFQIVGSFSTKIEQSTSYPYIFRFSYFKLQPGVTNSFSGITPCSKVNMLLNSFPLNYGPAWPTTLYRTLNSGELSRNGCDIILETQLRFTFDNGWFVMYVNDATITFNKPPAVSCYVYRGGFGAVGIGPTGPTGPGGGGGGGTGYTGPSGPTGPAGFSFGYQFDGGGPTNSYVLGPTFDCGGVN